MRIRFTIIFICLLFTIDFVIKQRKRPTVFIPDNETEATYQENYIKRKEATRRPASVASTKNQSYVGIRYETGQRDSNYQNSKQGFDVETPMSDDENQTERTVVYSGNNLQTLRDFKRSNTSNTNDSPKGSPSKSVETSFNNSNFSGAGPKSEFLNNDSKNSKSSTTEGSKVFKSLNCVSSIGGGTFNTPINVNLSCSSTALIRYCISEGSCANPCELLSGKDFATPIFLGADTQEYCLTFQGRTDGVQSKVEHVAYNFSTTAPHLETTWQKIVYQTTQLRGQISLASNDLPGDSLGFGLINFKSHDISNMNCEEIMDSVTTMTSPTPLEILPLTDVSQLSSGEQMNVFFDKVDLDYGENWLTAYHKGENFESNYSCEQNVITLEDFPFHESYASNSVMNVDGVLELSGGFTPIGVFEENSILYRGPAGIDMENKNQQELRVGFFGILYL